MPTPLEILYPNGRVEAVQVFIWDGFKPILWDGSVTFSGSLPSTVAGSLTNNNAAPAANNLGALTAIANASAPTWTEGRQVLLSTDLEGNLRVAATISTAGLATSANQTNGNQLTGLVAGTAVIGHVIVDSSALPTGAATEATLNDCETDLDTLVTSNAAIQTDTDLLATTFTPYFYISSGASNQDSAVVKNAAGRVGYISVFSTVAAARYVKLYDKSTGPTSSDTPVYVAAIPNNTTGAGSNLAIPPGIKFTTGISHRITTGAANNDTGAASTNDVVVNIGYV